MGKLSSGGRRELAYRELAAIQQRDGKLDLKKVKKFASNPTTWLHKELEWNDKVGGDKHRESQLRGIISDFKVWVTVKRNPGVRNVTATVDVRPFDRAESVQHNAGQVQVKAWQSLPTGKGVERAYVPTAEVMSAVDTRRQLLLDTITRLDSIREVHLFPELDAVAQAIKLVREKYADKRAKAALAA